MDNSERKELMTYSAGVGFVVGVCIGAIVSLTFAYDTLINLVGHVAH